MVTPADEAYKILQDKILAGELRPAQRLTEAKLVEELGISRSYLRQAFQRLAFDGLIDLHPNQGAVVSDVKLETVLDVFVAREALEVEAYRRAFERMDPTSLARLEALIQQMSEAIDDDDFELYSSSAISFRQMILETAGSRQLKELSNSLLLITSRVVLRKIMIPLRGKKSLAEHKQIIEALKGSSIQKVEDAFRNHIENLKKDIEQYWDIVKP